MTVKKVKIKNFRNIENLEFTPDSKMNVICGPNAQGKTNLLEAIWLFTGAKSFRGAKENEYITFERDEAKISIEFSKNSVLSDAEISIKDRRRATLNGNNLSSVGELAGNFCAIVFSPQDIELVKDGPSIRRKFLDTAIFQIYPQYADFLRKYVRAVAQRNNLLKDVYYHSELISMLDAFDNEIIRNGEKIIEYRKKYISHLKETAPVIYSGISENKESLEISYLCNCSSEYFAERLKNARREDIKTGVTSVGPHRDDIEFLINGKNARLFGSQGQKRSVALTLKLSEAEILKIKTGEETVALLDDVMSELDPVRQNYVLNHIKNWQVFITCCDPSNILNLSSGKVFTMKNGVLS